MENIRAFHEIEISVGHYTDIQVEPTCGLATPEKFIGEVDAPRYFLDAERFHAKILWFSEGFVEYKIPNFLLSTQNPEDLMISMEISSEAPLTNNQWPSDITFYPSPRRRKPSISGASHCSARASATTIRMT